MKYFLTFSLLIIGNILFAQYEVDVFGSQNISNSSGLWIVDKNTKSDINGSYLLFKYSNNFGIISTTQGRKFKVPNLNYNVKDDHIEAKISKDSVFIFDNQSIEKVVIKNKVFRRYSDAERINNGFLEIIATCKEMELLKKYHVIVKEGTINPLTRQKQTKDTYVIKFNYFIYAHNSMSEIRLKKSKILKYFERDSDKIIDYISENNLSFNHEEDLKLIFEYYDTVL